VNPQRILIVDDDPALLEALPAAIELRMEGIEIDTAETADAALERIRIVDHDAIVTDIKMPGMDGLALLAAIKQLRPRTPTLLITGHGEHDLAIQALRGGAYDYVAKPIDRDYFVASLARALQVRQLDRQVEEQRVALERHTRVLEHVDDGVFLVDGAEVIQHWNLAAEAILGIPRQAALGRSAGEVLPNWDVIAPLVPVAKTPGPGSQQAATVPVELDERELWLSISGVEFADGTVYAFRSLTEERALDELKGEFVATVSHELRTPLAAIYGSAQTLRERRQDLDDASQQRLLKVIVQESERLTRVASDILLAGRLDTGALKLAVEQVDIVPLAREVADEVGTTKLGNGELAIEVVAKAAVAPFAGDRDRLRQVLINLVENAVKYSPSGGKIEIRIESDDGRLRFAVQDTGVGIAQGEQRRIFGKFYRVDPNQTHGVGGTGLGLYICRELVRRMNGRIWVDSREGHGSTFFVELPAARSAVAV
jgi:two-component system, OmpR family, phosphate regulon sensor histidine kinase PhoR